jgi:hypothetical protein
MLNEIFEQIPQNSDTPKITFLILIIVVLLVTVLPSILKSNLKGVLLSLFIVLFAAGGIYIFLFN